jgi:hypothetical protein
MKKYFSAKLLMFKNIYLFLINQEKIIFFIRFFFTNIANRISIKRTFKKTSEPK